MPIFSCAADTFFSIFPIVFVASVSDEGSYNPASIRLAVSLSLNFLSSFRRLYSIAIPG